MPDFHRPPPPFPLRSKNGGGRWRCCTSNLTVAVGRRYVPVWPDCFHRADAQVCRAADPDASQQPFQNSREEQPRSLPPEHRQHHPSTSRRCRWAHQIQHPSWCSQTAFAGRRMKSAGDEDYYLLDTISGTALCFLVWKQSILLITWRKVPIFAISDKS